MAKITESCFRCQQFYLLIMGRGMRVFGSFLLAFLVWSCIFINKAKPGVEEPQPGDEKRGVAQVERELEEKKRWLERLNQEDQQTFAEMLELEERLDLTEKLILRLDSQLRSVKRELWVKQRSMRSTDSTLYSCQENTQNRLREIYKHGRSSSHPIMLVASSPVDLTNQQEFLKRILKKDQESLWTTELLRTDLTEENDNLNRMSPQLSWLQDVKQEERSLLLRELANKQKTLRRIESEKKICSQAILDLEQEAYGLHLNFSNALEQTTIADPGSSERFEAQRGKLPWPIQGSVASPFGLQRSSTFHTTTQNSGIEIKVESETEVVAVAGGKVLYVSRLKGYGNFVLLEHGGEYYTLYARLSEISVSPGENIRRLQKIGLVGHDGSSEVPYLHFEIRKGRESLDPLEWLR
jgi:septal ring factor EnvC (AmiA/AmiB activator)